MAYEIRTPWQLPFYGYWVRDFSGIHFDTEARRFLILSDDSKTIVAVDSSGKPLGRIPLKTVAKAKIPQPEDISISPDGRMFVLSEPNLLYVLP